jgi:hypothetical protein
MQDLEGATPFPPIAENSIELCISNHYKEKTLRIAIRDYPVPIEKPRGEAERGKISTPSPLTHPRRHARETNYRHGRRSR